MGGACVTRRTRTVVVASILVAATALATPHIAAAATIHRILFDNSKAETAGNADWIISTAQPDATAQNPNPTTERSWTGGISAWGVALQRTGQYSLKTLPSGNPFTDRGGGAVDPTNVRGSVEPRPPPPLS